MKIAVTYENGQVFQHFGHTSEFKIYSVEDNKIVSSEVMNTNGTGHEALATLLADSDVKVLICGGIGGGAVAALEESGIEYVSGVSGNTDDAVEAYLDGKLTSTGVNCDHHDHEHEHHHEDGGCGHCGHDDSKEGSCGNCSDDDSEGCGGGCGGCGGCHPTTPLFEGTNVGKTCSTHYKGTFDDGTVFDSSYDRGEPIQFVCGMGMMIHGFDKAVAEMKVGEKVNVHLEPNEAYGEVDPEAIFTVEIEELPGSENLTVDQKVYLQDTFGRPFPVKVVEKTDKTITLDANHEMAGKALNFEIELVEIKD
ncbi:FKBP-type peptidyl-prolyl cis-trans isomerase 2 [Butyrivibrio sp. INlla18]|uniref:FKBP-type peptidyl-prolyl cis-trans isomerase n=1 Tax=Butyrivibrio sp. INlla18 TaxID=1520806 RepID=UPI0008881B14|nr:FKBP-type peptidyl-prolyl cis-trans isomerase [Butyrivibrio sp. INlla18]SDA68187.1 FKBP-type peptidyl-prolyl cis-trans isomerase 2 [Butyrivibrio sp. INlla18]